LLVIAAEKVPLERGRVELGWSEEGDGRRLGRQIAGCSSGEKAWRAISQAEGSGFGSLGEWVLRV
jgi:hypothetical protein